MEKIKIALIASEECKMNSQPKNWFHIREFISKYKNSLSNDYEIYTNQWASNICNEPGLQLHNICIGNNEFQTTIYIASEVAKQNIKTVLIFQDPSDLRIDAVGNYALLRNCDLAGAYLYINRSIQLWADRYLNTSVKSTALVPEKGEKLALISHDKEKPRIMRFALHFREVLKKFEENIIATSGTKEKIINHLKEFVPPAQRFEIKAAGESNKIAHGPSGGDVVIANDIYELYQRNSEGNDLLYHVIFFMDHKNMQPHMADIQVLLKTCFDPINKVNLITNSRTAERWAEMYK